MPRKPSGGPRGRPVSPGTVARLANAQVATRLNELKELVRNIPPPPAPVAGDDPLAWAEKVREYSDMVTNLRYDILRLEMAERDPAEFVKLVSKTIETLRPKLARTETKLDAKIDQRTFVRVSERDEPLGMRQLEDGTWEPVFEAE